MHELTFETGLVELSVNGVKTIRINPSDVGFLETLYSLMAKIESIETETDKKREKATDLAKIFDCLRTCDKKMRDAVDSVFGDGFSDEVFKGVRLMAMADGLTVLENFIFAVIDKMDDSVKDNLQKRDGRISKYTEKYQKHHNKQ